MERRKTNAREKGVLLRREIERCVMAYNLCLRETVSKMSSIVLLRNVHPTFRSDYAYRLREEGLITVEQSKEFIKFVK